MTIIEAIKSGRPFRRMRPDGITIVFAAALDLEAELYNLTPSDVIAENWETEEPKVTITFSDLHRAYSKCTRSGMTTMRDLAKELGL